MIVGRRRFGRSEDIVVVAVLDCSGCWMDG